MKKKGPKPKPKFCDCGKPATLIYLGYPCCATCREKDKYCGHTWGDIGCREKMRHGDRSHKTNEEEQNAIARKILAQFGMI